MKFTRKTTTWRSCFDRTPESSQMTPITPSSSLSGQHVPFSFSTPHDMATNGSPRHSIASNSSGLSNPPSPGVTSHLRDSRDSYESWIFSLDCHVEKWFFFFFPHRKYLNKTWRILFICHRLLKTRDRVVFLIIIIKKKIRFPHFDFPFGDLFLPFVENLQVPQRHRLRTLPHFLNLSVLWCFYRLFLTIILKRINQSSPCT